MRNREEEGPVFFGGVLTGAVLTGLVFSIGADAKWIPWAYEHQNLAAGLMGSLAATFTSLILVWQIKNARDAAYRERQSKLAASKSVLPLALADFTGYARRSLAMSLDMSLGVAFTPEVPTIPDTHIETFQNCIAYADEDNRERLSALMKEYQIQRSRLQTAVSEYQPNPANVLYTPQEADHRAMFGGGQMFSSALLNCMIQELYAFARDSERDNETRSRADRIESIFFFLGEGQVGSYDADDWPNFIAHFKRMADRKN